VDAKVYPTTSTYTPTGRHFIDVTSQVKVYKMVGAEATKASTFYAG